MAKPVDVNEASFDKVVLQAKEPVLVDFWAPWCGPCKMVGPVVEELAKEYAGKIKVCKMNTDENPVTASAYRISAIPTLLFFKGGKVMNDMQGMQPKEEMKKSLDALLA